MTESYLTPFIIVQPRTVAVQSTFGTISTKVLMPGSHLANPVSYYQTYDTAQQVDVVNNCNCVSKELTEIKLNIAVVNQLEAPYVVEMHKNYGPDYDRPLVFDKVQYSLLGMCSKMSMFAFAVTEFSGLGEIMREYLQSENDKLGTGLKIIEVRFSKPILPKSIEESYLKLAEERAKKDIDEVTAARLDAQKIADKRHKAADNEIAQQYATSQNTLQELKITSENKILVMNVQAEKTVREIQDVIVVNTAKANAEKAQLEADITKTLFAIPGYTDVEIAKHLSQNQKTVIIGNEIPKLAFMAMPMPMQMNGEGKDGFFPMPMPMSDQ